MEPAQVARLVTQNVMNVQQNVEKPCELGDGATALLDASICSAVKAVAPANLDEAPPAQVVPMYEQLCTEESYQCFESFENGAADALKSSACTDYKAANPDEKVSNPANFVCSRLDAEKLCISALAPGFFNTTAPAGSCEEKYQMTWQDSPGADYTCCSIAEMGCCLPTILGASWSDAQLDAWVADVNTLCYPGSANPPYSKSSCELDRTKATYFFEVVAEYSVLIGDWKPAVLGDIATTYGVDVSAVSLVSAVGESGSPVTVTVSIRVNDKAALDTLAASAAGKTLDKSEVEAVIQATDSTVTLNVSTPTFSEKVKGGVSGAGTLAFSMIGALALLF
jgi:hypothetical protein